MEEQTTLNTGGDITSPAGSSPASGNFDAFIPTMPEDAAAAQPTAESQKPVEQDASMADDAAVEAPGEAEDASTEDSVAGETDDKPEPFHKHPRFQELTTQNREMKQALQEMRQQMEVLAKGRQGDDPAQPQAPDLDAQFAEISRKLEDGDLSLGEALTEQQKLIEASGKRQLETFMEQQKREAETAKMKEQFLSKYPDYAEVTQGDELSAIIDADPIHDEVSAYGIYKWQQEIASKEVAIKEAVDKAVKETEARVRKEYAAKRNAASLGDSAAHVPRQGSPPELQDTKKFGGRVNVLANRLKALRDAV